MFVVAHRQGPRGALALGLQDPPARRRRGHVRADQRRAQRRHRQRAGPPPPQLPDRRPAPAGAPLSSTPIAGRPRPPAQEGSWWPAWQALAGASARAARGTPPPLGRARARLSRQLGDAPGTLRPAAMTQSRTTQHRRCGHGDSADRAAGLIENRTFDEIDGRRDAPRSTRTLSREDIELFAVMSGDVNPAHLDEEYAHSDMFHEIIAHGMWGASLISTLLGTRLPGPGHDLPRADAALPPPGDGRRHDHRLGHRHREGRRAPPDHVRLPLRATSAARR